MTVLVKRLAGTRVLVVEDELDALESMRLLIELHGGHVLAVGAAEAALAVLLDFRPHVILSDLWMPDLDGAQLIARVRLFPDPEIARVPAVAITAHDGAEERLRAFAAGFQRFLTKPVEPQALIDTLAALAAP